MFERDPEGWSNWVTKMVNLMWNNRKGLQEGLRDLADSEYTEVEKGKYLKQLTEDYLMPEQFQVKYPWVTSLATLALDDVNWKEIIDSNKREAVA